MRTFSNRMYSKSKTHKVSVESLNLPRLFENYPGKFECDRRNTKDSLDVRSIFQEKLIHNECEIQKKECLIHIASPIETEPNIKVLSNKVADISTSSNGSVRYQSLIHQSTDMARHQLCSSVQHLNTIEDFNYNVFSCIGVSFVILSVIFIVILVFCLLAPRENSFSTRWRLPPQ